MVAAFCRATQAKAASGHSLSPPSESACPGAALQFGALFLCRPLRWGERVGHQWQRGRTGRNGVYDEPPVRRRSHGHLRDVLLVHRHERERSLRCALRPLSNRVSAAAGLGVGGQGGRGRGAGAGESCGDIEDHIARRSFAPAAAPAAGFGQADRLHVHKEWPGFAIPVPFHERGR